MSKQGPKRKGTERTECAAVQLPLVGMEPDATGGLSSGYMDIVPNPPETENPRRGIYYVLTLEDSREDAWSDLGYSRR